MSTESTITASTDLSNDRFPSESQVNYKRKNQKQLARKDLLEGLI
ncbi:MAG: hypothetical protein P4M12_05205 [Gammaproteobacteria bacterium]|nr:hypothetical protein [Gammaproteobacteria bacterium]